VDLRGARESGESDRGKVGEWFIAAWDAASYLLVLGAHEAKLDSESVKARLPSIERMIVEARRVVCGG